MISARFAEALQSRRSDFNQRFRLATQRHPHLDGDEVLQFVAECVDPVVQAVHARNPHAVDDVVVAAYDCALQLVGQRLTAQQGRFAIIGEVWREVLPAAASFLSADTRLIPALTNAVHQLATIDTKAAVRWKQRMVLAASQVASAEELLLLGQVFAWQCGLAHYREGALATLESLDERLACFTLGVSPAQRQETLRRLLADRWFDPTNPKRQGLKVARTFGAFRGFGGGFLQPPLIRSAPGGWVVQSAADHWFVVADAFGATLHRAGVDEWNSAADRGHHVGTRVTHAGRQLDLPGAGPITSSALSEHAIACTFAHSHQIVLVALPS